MCVSRSPLRGVGYVHAHAYTHTHTHKHCGAHTLTELEDEHGRKADWESGMEMIRGVDDMMGERSA